MSNEDRKKEFEDNLKAGGVSQLDSGDEDFDKKLEELNETAIPLLTLRIMDPSKCNDPDIDGKVGMLMEWDDEFGNPGQWDHDNLTEQQMFCLMFLASLQEFVESVARMNSVMKGAGAAALATSEDDYNAILAAMEDIDKSQMN